MKLTEFFNKPMKIKHQSADLGADKKHDDLFWYIIDHDKLHKDHFYPIARKIKKLKECTPEQVLELFMPMVVKGCREFHHDKKLKGKLGAEFSKEMREDLCHRLHDHYRDDIKKDTYKLG